jgi:cell division protein FtsB
MTYLDTLRQERAKLDAEHAELDARWHALDDTADAAHYPEMDVLDKELDRLAAEIYRLDQEIEEIASLREARVARAWANWAML